MRPATKVAVGVLGARTTAIAVAAAAIVAAGVFALADGRASGGGPDDDAPNADTVDADTALLALGGELYAVHCSSCHGIGGQGIEGRGPTLGNEGPAAVDFVLRTGRMPMEDPTMQARSGPVRFDEEEIVALVAYVGLLGEGPEIPDVDPARGDVSRGGELYRLNCAACHVASGAGAPIGGGRRAPNLTGSTPTEIGEAILVGPGAMPVFGSLTPQDIDDIAAYIAELDEENTTGVENLGGVGPVAEGLAAWLLALVPLIALTRWIGSPRSGRDPDIGESELEAELDPELREHRAAASHEDRGAT